MRSRLAALLFFCACGDAGDGITATADAAMPGPDASIDVVMTDDARVDAVTVDGSDTSLRYDQIQAKSIHNSYDRDEPIFDQLLFHRTRSVEVDIHNGKSLAPSLTNDWYVYHADAPGFRNTSCDKLSDCLDELAAFQRQVPQHEVVTLLVDLKDDFIPGHDATAFDAMLEDKLGIALVRPKDLGAACPAAKSVREAVTGACRFPTLASLRGKIFVAVTGGASCSGTGKLATYAGPTGLAPAAFVAPSIDDTCAFSAYDKVGHAVFFNMDLPHAVAAKAVRAAGLVGRVYKGGIGGGLDAQVDWDEAKADGAHFLATNKVNYLQDAWSTTHGPGGYPFSCVGPCALPTAELGRDLGVDVRSGDIDGTADSFTFLHDTVLTGKASWTAAISVPSSHVEEWAKGCVMARATLAADSPYFAICRSADVHPIRIQYRTTAGGGTTKIELGPHAGWTDESTFYVRLTVNGASVIGDGSADGQSWATLGQATLTQTPVLQGIAASGHDSATPVRMLFSEVTRKEGANAIAFTKAGAKASACVGGCPTQGWFDGVVP